MDLALTTKVVPWNDVEALQRALAPGDVACVLAEPALTTSASCCPSPASTTPYGAARRTGTLLVIDETHTSVPDRAAAPRLSAGADVLTIGKAISSSVPAGAYSVSAASATRIEAREDADSEDVRGIGRTLAGRRSRRGRSHDADRGAHRGGVRADHPPRGPVRCGHGGRDRGAGLPWHVTELGCRARTASQPYREERRRSAEAGDDDLERFLHLYALDRGTLMSPFHNLALMSPATSEANVDLHTRVFTAAVAELV